MPHDPILAALDPPDIQDRIEVRAPTPKALDARLVSAAKRLAKSPHMGTMRTLKKAWIDSRDKHQEKIDEALTEYREQKTSLEVYEYRLAEITKERHADMADLYKTLFVEPLAELRAQYNGEIPDLPLSDDDQKELHTIMLTFKDLAPEDVRGVVDDLKSRGRHQILRSIRPVIVAAEERNPSEPWEPGPLVHALATLDDAFVTDDTQTRRLLDQVVEPMMVQQMDSVRRVLDRQGYDEGPAAQMSPYFTPLFPLVTEAEIQGHTERPPLDVTILEMAEQLHEGVANAETL